MKSRTILLVGCGDLGIRMGTHLVAQGSTVHAVRRGVEKLPDTFVAHAADYAEPGSLDFAAPLRPDYVIATLNPSERSESGYRRGFEAGMGNLLRGLKGHLPRLILMSSSTRVYAERDGGWVDEDSPLTDSDPRAAAIIAAESALLGADIQAGVVRFGGIYGSPGGRLISRISRGEIAPAEPVRYTNRIHRQDAAGFILHLMELADRGRELRPVYIGVDDLPAPRHEVESWLARRLGVDVTAAQPAGRPGNNGGHKRCRNTALHESGYGLRYPDYRSGYGALLRE